MDNIKNQTRKQYFKDYYLKNKNKYGNKDSKTVGRPKKEVPKFSIVKLDTPITIRFD